MTRRRLTKLICAARLAVLSQVLHVIPLNTKIQYLGICHFNVDSLREDSFMNETIK